MGKRIVFSFSALIIIFSGIADRTNGFRENFLKFDDKGISFLLNEKFSFKPQLILWDKISSIEIKPVRFTVKLTDEKEEEISLANFTYHDVLEIKDVLKEICSEQNISLS
jgi:hypothetical protein